MDDFRTTLQLLGVITEVIIHPVYLCYILPFMQLSVRSYQVQVCNQCISSPELMAPVAAEPWESGP